MDGPPFSGCAGQNWSPSCTGNRLHISTSLNYRTIRSHKREVVGVSGTFTSTKSGISILISPFCSVMGSINISDGCVRNRCEDLFLLMLILLVSLVTP
jgi:hypothetical protein